MNPGNEYPYWLEPTLLAQRLESLHALHDKSTSHKERDALRAAMSALNYCPGLWIGFKTAADRDAAIKLFVAD